MRLAIVIVNYRTPKLVIDCLTSLQTEIEVGRDLVAIVDNASGDDSVVLLEEAIALNDWSQWVKVIASPVNGGFSAGNNVGIKAVTADAYLLLNSDTIVRPGAIATLLRTLENCPEAGLVSPRLEWPDGTPQISCFRYHSPISELIDAAATGPITKLFFHYNVSLPVSAVPIEPEWTSFACVLVRREVIERIGLMDEGYFMYFDDVDYCRQVTGLKRE
jgi:N-acetylglucosaminyl-diphospho-decaprenol L-rhamnosyltransferase